MLSTGMQPLSRVAQQTQSGFMPRPFTAKLDNKAPPEASQRRDPPPTAHHHHQGIMHWRHTLDIAAVECMAAVIVEVSAIVYANVGFGAPGMFISPWAQLIPALPVGLVMLVCKCDRYMPPDASPTVTFLMWMASAFHTWVEAAARLFGHTLGFVISIFICKDMSLPPQWYPVQRPGAVTFACEAAATTIEHVAIICLLLPLSPPAELRGPPNTVVLHAAVIMAATHWILRVTFATDMNPAVLLGKAIVGTWQLQRPGATADVTVAQVWDDCLMGVWGELVGLGLAVVYTCALCKGFQMQAKSSS